LLSLYQADLDPHWFSASVHAAEAILDRFRDPAGGFFDTPRDHEPLISRPKSIQDHATPSGNALAVELFLRLWALTEDEAFRQTAEGSLASIQNLAGAHPQAFAAWLCDLDLALGPGIQLAVVGSPDDPSAQAFLEIVWPRYLPRLSLAAGDSRLEGAPRLLAGREPIDGRATAFLCRGFVCQLPARSPADLERQLDDLLRQGRAQEPEARE
jgi:hypothetical protein